MPKVQIRDIQMYYEERGSGSPLVMIQGLAANLDWWGEQLLDGLAQKRRVIVFDNRGAGRSDRPASDYSIAQFAEDTIGLMDYLGIEHADVLGYSMGGMIAQELAIRYPARVDRLILAATTCGGTDHVQAKPEVLAALTPMGTEEQRKQNLIFLLFPDSYTHTNTKEIEDFWNRVLIAPIDDQSMMRQVTAIVLWGCGERLSQIQVPTLVLHGTEDVLVPSANGRILADRIMGAQLQEFEGGGHGFIGQFSEEVTRATVRFLSE